MHSIFFPFVCNLQQTDITEYFPLSGLDIFFTLAQSDTVESEANGRNSKPWTFLFQWFTIFNVTNPPRRNVCIQTMDWRNFIIVQNSEDLYIFRSRAWKWSRSRHHVSCLRCLPPHRSRSFLFWQREEFRDSAAWQLTRSDWDSALINIVTQVSTHQLLPDVLWHHPVTLWPGSSWATWWPASSSSGSQAWPASTWTRVTAWCTPASRAASSASLWPRTGIATKAGECLQSYYKAQVQRPSPKYQVSTAPFLGLTLSCREVNILTTSFSSFQVP